MFAEIKNCFLKNLNKSWLSLAWLQLPSDFWVAFWTNESEKNCYLFLCKPSKEEIITWQRRKKEKISSFGIITWRWPMKQHHVTFTKKEAHLGDILQRQSHFFVSFWKKQSSLSATGVLSQRPNLINYNTTASWDKLTSRTMWTSKNVKTDLVNFYGPKMIPFTWVKSLKCSRKMTTGTIAWSKVLQWKRKISTSSCTSEVSWSLQQKTLLEKKTCPKC